MKLVNQFIHIRSDYATKTLERAAPGKFVEAFVQCLQQMATGTFDAKVDVDRYLNTRVENESELGDNLRICAARIARAVYALRSKRNIVHDNQIDPNTSDLAFIHQAAAWILAELLRTASGISMEDAGVLIARVEAPVGPLIEEIEGTRIVHADVGVRVELLLLMQSHFPAPLTHGSIMKSLSRRESTGVRKRLRELHADKLAHGDARSGYRLTQAGYALASSEISKILSA